MRFVAVACAASTYGKDLDIAVIAEDGSVWAYVSADKEWKKLPDIPNGEEGEDANS